MQSNAFLKPLKLSAAISLVGLLAACSGNDSSTSSGPAPYILNITVDKTIAEVEWSANNAAVNASHAYRAITKNSMLRLVFTNQLAAFDALINLLRVDSERNCYVSGRMIAEAVPEICYNASEVVETCTDASVIRENTQESQAIDCQDGTVSGLYFDGFFNTTARTDFTIATEDRTSTAISAVGQAVTYDKNGDVALDIHGDPILLPLTDYLFQSDTSTFFFDNQYESYVDFSTTNLTCGSQTYKQVERQGMRSTEVGSQEGTGTSDFYLYTKFTGLDLQSIPVETCGEDDKQVVNYTYSFTATMASAAMGGGTDKNTLVAWPDLAISLAGVPSGTLTLVHKNTGADYTVILDLNTAGQVTITPDVGTPFTLTLAEFLALSEPPARS